VLPAFGVVNFALSGLLIVGFAQFLAGGTERLPKRPRLFNDISVPLPGDATIDPAPAV
jgi:hypothetical protein